MAAHGSHYHILSEEREGTGDWYHNYDGYHDSTREKKDRMDLAVHHSPRRMLPYESRVLTYEDEYDNKYGRYAGGENYNKNRNNDRFRPEHRDAGKGGWELPEGLTPRRTTYQPSFHENGVTPRRVPLWERDKVDNQRRQMGFDTPRISENQSPRPDGLNSPRRGKDEIPKRGADEVYGRGTDDNIETIRRDVYETFAREKNRKLSVSENDLRQRLDYSRQPPYPSPRQDGGLDPRMINAKALDREERYQGGGAFLFVRFPLARGENVTGVAKACIRAKTSDLGGRFAGIARKVYSFGYPPSPDEGCAVFHFPSLKNAEVFFHSDQRFRQPDFPPPQGHSEIFALGLTTDPNQVYNYATFLLSEVFLHGSTSVGDYITKFKEPFSSLLIHKYKALPFVAFSLDKDDRKSLRRHYFAPKSILTLHLFRSIGHLEEVMADERYTHLRVVHNSIAQEKCSIFTIDSEACP